MHPTIHRAHSEQRVSTRGRRLWGLGLAALALALLLGTLATMIVRSQQESRSHLESNLRLRGESTATLVATYLTQQADRQKDSAERFLSGRTVTAREFEVVARAFGSNAAVLLDAHGRLIDSVPLDPALHGRQIAARYAHLAIAERGQVAVSNVVSSAARAQPVTAVAVPFRTPQGRRVFSAAYGVGSAEMSVFVDHTITYSQHEVLLVDGGGRVLAASPRFVGGTVAQIDPALAHAAAHASHGRVVGARTATTFTSAAVPGTHWRVLLAVPDSRLYATISGLTSEIPWAVLAIVTLFAGLLMVLFARLLADRARLGALSRELSRMARTDTLTGLLNRRGLNDHLTRATAHARRRGDPLSVLMIDLDRFKQVNDHYGHDAGDRVLCALADCMRDVLRAEDVYGRIGGDEFMVILAGADADAAQAATARLHHAVRQVDLSDVGLSEGIPMSVGSATAVITYPEEIQRAADVELYRVKGAKRVHPEPVPGPAS
jgi:diguanylate cyclase (GGDEF)-like protein